MKVLFVSSGNGFAEISPIIKNQGESLLNKGVDLKYFTIQGKGIVGYLRNIPRLRREMKVFKPDVVHAHYSLCGFIASLSGSKVCVCSLMGSDVKSKSSQKKLILFFSRFLWKKVIVKSEDMYQSLGCKKAEVVPNGVDIDRFYPMDKKECQKLLGWNTQKKHILFAANPERYEKNFDLAKEAYDLMNDINCELHVLKKVPNDQMPLYHNAADVVLLTSLWEGSPNVIKEAMACCRPIVCTNVGDVEYLFGKSERCFLIEFNPNECKSKLRIALNSISMTSGLSRIQELGLDSCTIANKLLYIYSMIRCK